eukprot:m.81913 g.81913  ORF g.81913 m.81913 type:complete len:305 (+) comp25468_c0_seq2:75-989(+)
MRVLETETVNGEPRVDFETPAVSSFVYSTFASVVSVVAVSSVVGASAPSVSVVGVVSSVVAVVSSVVAVVSSVVVMVGVSSVTGVAPSSVVVVVVDSSVAGVSSSLVSTIASTGCSGTTDAIAVTHASISSLLAACWMYARPVPHTIVNAFGFFVSAGVDARTPVIVSIKIPPLIFPFGESKYVMLLSSNTKCRFLQFLKLPPRFTSRPSLRATLFSLTVAMVCRRSTSSWMAGFSSSSASVVSTAPSVSTASVSTVSVSTTGVSTAGVSTTGVSTTGVSTTGSVVSAMMFDIVLSTLDARVCE